MQQLRPAADNNKWLLTNSTTEYVFACLSTFSYEALQ